jgi:hypothetical protein
MRGSASAYWLKDGRLRWVRAREIYLMGINVVIVTRVALVHFPRLEE